MSINCAFLASTQRYSPVNKALAQYSFEFYFTLLSEDYTNKICNTHKNATSMTAIGMLDPQTSASSVFMPIFNWSITNEVTR